MGDVASSFASRLRYSLPLSSLHPSLGVISHVRSDFTRSWGCSARSSTTHHVPVTCSAVCVEMSGLSGNTGLPKPFNINSHHFMWTPERSGLLDDDWVHLNYDSPVEEHSQARQSARTRGQKKKRSRKPKTKRASHFHGYVLQVIGLLCFILAAVKLYEPLTGIGFTLILLGYNKNAKKDCRIGKRRNLS